MALRRYGGRFGGSPNTHELLGVVVHPGVQQRGLGSLLVRAYVAAEQPRQLLAYTRNPGVLRILGDAAEVPNIVAATDKVLLGSIAPHVEVIDDTAYHVGRYGAEGLYGGADPADKHYGQQRLVDAYPPLEANRSTALAVLARLGGAAL